jgi:SOS-response transcriptional repressor LexA
MKELSVNLKKLITGAEISESELSRKTNIAQPIIHRILNRQNTNPKIETIRPIANFFGVTISQLIGESLLFYENEEFSKPELQKLTALPLLSWEKLTSWLAAPEQQIKKHPKIITDLPTSKLAYALKIVDASLEPLFLKGTILIVEPKREPKNGDFVIMKQKNQNIAVIRQFILDGELKYLKSLHAEVQNVAPKLMSADNFFCGVVIQSKTNY